MLSTSACTLHPSLVLESAVLCSLYFVSSAKLIAKSIFYLATGGGGGLVAIFVLRLHLQLALLTDCIWVARCLVWAPCSALCCFMHAFASRAPLTQKRWLLSDSLALASGSLIVSSITCRRCLWNFAPLFAVEICSTF